MKSNYLIIGIVALATAATIFEIAAGDTDPRKQTRIINLPPVTEAALLTSGIDRQTLNDYLAQTSAEATSWAGDGLHNTPALLATSHSALATEQEVKPAPGRTKPLTAGSKGPNNHRALKVTVTATPKGWIPVEISVYSVKYHNRRTATGERYDHHAGFTAATTRRANGWDLPRGSVWEVSYRGKTVVVRVNDCGSYRPRKAKLWLDLSGAAWRKVAGSPSRHVARMRRVR